MPPSSDFSSPGRRVLPVLLLLACAVPCLAQRQEFPPEEFSERRSRLCERLEADQPGDLLLFAETMPRPGVRFRQDHDFWYLTGIESRNAAIVIDPTDCQTTLFLPVQGEREKFIDGPNWLDDPEAAIAYGLSAVQPITYLPEFLARRRRPGTQPLWVRLSERDEIDQSRSEKGLHLGRREGNPFGAQPSTSAWQVNSIRQRYPHYELLDATPHLDRLRMIKTPREIEVLRVNGRASADGIARAIRATRAGEWEYTLEAEAKHEFLLAGAEMEAYPAIVGSGPNVNLWHYNHNARQLEGGDLIVMDYGASFAYLTMDITRTWPVSGRFDDRQLRAYQAVLEAQKAIIDAMRPGATREETREICRRVYDKWGFEDKPAHGAGHFVGLAVHDVGDSKLPFEPGMVIAVEPIIEEPEHHIHIRIEDTVLVTDGAPEILSASVPKDVDGLLALVGTPRRAATPERVTRP